MMGMCLRELLSKLDFARSFSCGWSGPLAVAIVNGWVWYCCVYAFASVAKRFNHTCLAVFCLCHHCSKYLSGQSSGTHRFVDFKGQLANEWAHNLITFINSCAVIAKVRGSMKGKARASCQVPGGEGGKLVSGYVRGP